jgi:uncharacterized protein (TIGR02271 family)
MSPVDVAAVRYGDRLPLNQQSLNDPNPMGTTYQEPMGSRDELEQAGSYGDRTGIAGNLQNSRQRHLADRLLARRLGRVASNLQGSSLTGSMQRSASSTNTAAIPVVQEQLKVGKREVQRGGVRVFSRVVETPVNESVGLREEHVNVERRPVNEPISGADTTAFKEQSIEMRETAEEAVVEKSARVVEEVTINKEVTQREQQINDTVRHTEVEVEQLGARQPDAHRVEHDGRRRLLPRPSAAALHSSTYGSTGSSYDTYQPAYSYGTEMRESQMYRNRPWDEVEPTCAAAGNPQRRATGSTWENMKAAVRHGWDKMTSNE